MINRLHLSDFRTIAHYLGTLILLIALSMLFPFLLSLFLQEYDASVEFLFAIGITLLCGSLLLICKIDKGSLDWRQALIITALCWAILSLFGALPLWFSGHYSTFLNAYFESMSAFTTTGLSLVVDLDHMALSMVVWRCVMHLMGGVGVVVIALALGVFGSGAAAASLYQAEAKSTHVMPELRQTSVFIARVTIIIVSVGTIVCFIPCLLMGQEPVRAIISSFCITAASYSTGGLSMQSMGLMHYHCWPLEVIAVILAIFGCVNFMLYGDIFRGRLKLVLKDIEIRTIVLWVTALTVLMALALMFGTYFTDVFAMLRRGLFELCSACFNLGLSTMYSGQLLYGMGTGVVFVLILGMTIAGSMSSISGGIKAYRIGVIAKGVIQIVREALAPDSARPRTFFYYGGRQLVNTDMVSSAMTITLLYVCIYALGAIVAISYGYDGLAAIFESVSAGANDGLSAGITSVGMPVPLEVVYIIEMWLGRLEFIAVFATILQFVLSFTPLRKSFRFGRKAKGGRNA